MLLVQLIWIPPGQPRSGHRKISPKNACINNLRQIDGAKEQWAYETKATQGDPCPASELIKYLKPKSLPLCPSHGQYQIGSIDQPPTCTIKDHTL